MKKLFIIFLFIIIPFALKATDFYVRTDGSNSNDGLSNTAGGAWRTLAYACATVPSGAHVIYVGVGTFVETTQSSLKVGVSIEGASKTTTIIKSTNTSTYVVELYSSTTNNNGNQHISGIRFESNTPYSAYAAININKRGNVKIYNCDFYYFNYYAIRIYGGEPPSIYSANNEVHDCYIYNCAAYIGVYSSGDSKGAIDISGQDGLLIYNNTITLDRPDHKNGNCIDGVEGFIKNMKVYNNTLTKIHWTGETWDFAIEIWNWLGGNEIYNNNITGSIDVVMASKGASTYGVWIHDNIIGQPTLRAQQSIRGVLIEIQNSDVIIERNYIHDVAQGIYFQETGPTRLVQDIRISYNIMNNIGSLLDNTGWGIYWSVEERDDIADNINIWNNVIIAANNSYSTRYGIGLPDIGTATDVSVKNNIVVGFDDSPVFAYGGGGTTIDRLSIENNIFYNNGNGNLPHYTGGMVPTNNITQNNIISNPLFLSSDNFNLQSGSPAINTGINVGLTLDYDSISVSNPPERGAYEYETGVVLPTIITTAATEITIHGATLGGEIINDGGAQVTQGGVAWNTWGSPAIDNCMGYTYTYYPPWNLDNPFSMHFEYLLQPNQLYYIRAYAINSAGTAYGDERSFTTLPAASVKLKITGGKFLIFGGSIIK